MLQIYIYGPRESGFLDLPPGATLELEADANILDEDFLLSEFSLPVDIPWTENNRRLMGNPERFKNMNTDDLYYRATVYDSGIPEMEGAKLQIIGKEGSFSYRNGKFLAVVTGTKGMFGRQLKNKYLSDLQLGGKITWNGMDSRQFATAHMKGDFPQYPYITFVPVAIENYFDTSRPDYDGEFLARDTVNTLILNNGGWTFGRPQAAEPTLPATPGTPEYADYRTVPFLKVKYLLRKIFEEHGYRVSGEFLEHPDYDDLTVFNACGLEDYSPGYEDFNRSITPSNHVPNLLIVDYLSGLFSAFSMYPVFHNNEVRLIMRKNLNKERTIFSINGICDEQFVSSKESDELGYTINYNWDNDGYISDRLSDRKDKNVLGTVAITNDLQGFVVGRQLTTDDLVFVTAENMYYQVANATTTPVKWEPFAEALEEYVSGEGDRNVEIKLSTLCSYVEFVPDIALQVKRPYVGTRLQGSYKNNKGVFVKNNCPHKIFWSGLRYNRSGMYVPVSANGHLDEDGRQLFPFSLALSGVRGMVAIFHAGWQDAKERMEIVKTTLQVNRRVMKGITENVFLEKDGVLFLVSKVERTVPLGETVDVELLV